MLVELSGQGLQGSTDSCQVSRIRVYARRFWGTLWSNLPCQLVRGGIPAYIIQGVKFTCDSRNCLLIYFEGTSQLLVHLRMDKCI